MPICAADRTALRTLAAQVAELAALPEMTIRRKKWVEHNSLRSTEPVMFISPEGAWEEMILPSDLHCEGDEARSIEWELRHRLYVYTHFQDDSVIEAEWIVNAPLRDTGWGLEPVKEASTEQRGAFRIRPILNNRDDLQKLRLPDLIYDRAAHEDRASQMHDLFGDLLTIKPRGVSSVSYHLWSQYIYLRGENRYMEDFMDAPDFVHEVMRLFETGHHRLLQQMMNLNLLSLNNDNTYHSSGGNGYTDQLPAPGFDPAHVRPCDMWASAESQELAGVSPKMHREFALEYEKRLLAPFGLNGYGCCEDLSRKIKDVLTLPNLRRISISPFADVDRSAIALAGQAIYSWKPQPAHLVGEFNADLIRAYIRHTVEVCRENGCFLEIILKDTHTCEHHPERFDLWTQIARQEMG